MAHMDLIDVDIREKITEIGRFWRKSGNNRRISEDVLKLWDRLITEWADAEDMPLVIRKGSLRGRSFMNSGREIIISDNTFAIWVYSKALRMSETQNPKNISLDDIREMLRKDEIPFVYALSKEDRNNKEVKYRKALGRDALSDAEFKWKLCHIDPVGLNCRKPIAEMDIESLIDHFIKYANPKNMFILPKEIGGLGEVKEFINEQK